MNLPPKTQIKFSNTRHLSKYLYKVVLTGSANYRLRNWKTTITEPPKGGAGFVDSLNKEGRLYYELFELLRGKDVSVRLEYLGAFVYTSDVATVEALVKLWGSKTVVYMPLADIPEDTVILKRKIPFNYRVTISFPGGRRDYAELVEWCDSVRNQIKMSNWSRQSLKTPRYWRTPIRIYVRDERTISMLRLVAGNQVTKIEKIEFL